MKKYLFIFSLLGLILLCGCTDQPISQGSSEQTDDFTDALGNKVNVSQPQRVVALLGSFAEIWELAGGELVGVTDDALQERTLNLPEDIAVVGKHNSPNVEAILALDPDLVILSAETQAHVALQPLLAQTNIPAAYFSVTSFEDYLAMLKTCTEITGREDMYQQHGQTVQTEIQTIMAEIPEGSSPRVLLLITYSGGIAVQKSDSMTGQMLQDLGCENIVDKTPSLLNEFSLERIITEDPDFIFVIPMGNDDDLAVRNLQESIESKSVWQDLRAVKNGQYILLPKEQFLYKPNVRWGTSYEYLAQILYGQA